MASSFETSHWSGRRGCAVITVGLSITLAIWAAAPAARAVPIFSYSSEPSTTQAGGHPNILTRFDIGNNAIPEPNEPECGCNDPRNLTFHQPAGLIGNPHAAPQCTDAAFASLQCPVDSQVGAVKVLHTGDGETTLREMAIYNLEPHPGEAGLLGFWVPILNAPIYEVLNARTGSDYGLDFEIRQVTQLQGLKEIVQVLWGVPADPSNNAERYPPEWNSELGYGEGGAEPPTSSNSPLTPFIQNPTSCGIPLSSTLEVVGYDNSTSEATAPFPATTGCELLSFNPSLSAAPTTTQADSASGLELNLSVPQQESPTVPSPSEIRATTITLPEGFSINPNAADGKESCTEAEARFGTEEEAQCPEYSKIGSLTLENSALPGPISGYLYLGEPRPGNRYRAFLTANGFNTHVKLAGSVEPNLQTGQIKISFQDLPQTPLTEFNLHVFGSERGLFATPTQCGSYPVETTFTPWDAGLPEQDAVQFFSVTSGPDGGPCPPQIRPFKPTIDGASAKDEPGVHSPFAVEFTRNDGDQDVSALEITFPPGLLATLSEIPYCSDEALMMAQVRDSGLSEESSSSCPSASQIGTADTGVGAGTHPLFLLGKAYLAGPYKGAPLSVAVITPAVSGPYDLGNVVVRAALRVNPETAQITAVSDPLPTIIDGIPLRIRNVRVSLDRPNFTLNPTNCNPFSITSEIVGDQGTVATPSKPFQVVNCLDLRFGPKLALAISGATRHSGNPSLTATVAAIPNESNLASTSVTLNHSEIIDNSHIRNPCTKVEFAASACPASSVIGYARAETPLLGAPLQGPVYLRSAPENKSGLPDIVAALNGQIDIDLVGKIETASGRLRTTFASIPDAPVSKFTLRLDGGKKGLLQNSTNLCEHRPKAITAIDGQNGASLVRATALGTPCHRSSDRRSGRRPQHGEVAG